VPFLSLKLMKKNSTLILRRPTLIEDLKLDENPRISLFIYYLLECIFYLIIYIFFILCYLFSVCLRLMSVVCLYCSIKFWGGKEKIFDQSFY